MVLINNLKIKKVVVILIIIIQILTLTSCVETEGSIRKYVDNTVERIFTSIKNDDKEMFGNLFCKGVRNDDFTGDIDKLFEHISGDVISYEFDGLINQGRTQQDGSTEIVASTNFTLCTSTNEYYIGIRVYPRNDFDENKVGIECFSIIDTYDWNYDYRYGAHRENRGIYIDLGYTKLFAVSEADDNRDFINEISGLVERNNTCVNKMFINDSLPYEKTNITDEYALVNSDDFKTLDDIKSILNITYTGDVVNSLIDGTDGKPQYKEINGKLYTLVREFDEISQWSNFIIESYSLKEICEFSVLAQYQFQDGADVIVRYTYKAVYVDGQWKLDEIVSDYRMVGKGTIEDNSVMIVGHMEGEKMKGYRPDECYKK
ncbi:MAG: DUF5104 domain-containing protein [Clostridia bacterium]|nr:DUF5104 domain-containing protein [Clostridia bacterium]